MYVGLTYYQVGHFTLDNASNNGSFMYHLKLLLEDINVSFDDKKNYIRCFAHVINLCSQAVIKVMEKDDVDPAYSDTETEPGTESENSDNGEAPMRPPRYSRKAGPIRRARKTVLSFGSQANDVTSFKTSSQKATVNRCGER